MKPLRVYADTSVYGGVFDEEFCKPSRMFFEQVQQGYFMLVISSLIRDELEKAPMNVKDFFTDIRKSTEIIDVSEDSLLLQSEYLKTGIVGPKWEADALHVALATVSRCQILVSWNFKHIVHYGKIPLYNAVNLIRGYNSLAIHTPPEVVINEENL